MNSGGGPQEKYPPDVKRNAEAGSLFAGNQLQAADSGIG